MDEISFLVNPPIDSPALNALYAASWPRHVERDTWPELAHSLAHIWAYAGERLVGFVYVAWDGGVHAFLLDPTVRPDLQRQGIGSSLIHHAIGLARSKGVEWLHVDYEPCLAEFYAKCGFRPTEAGLMDLKEGTPGRTIQSGNHEALEDNRVGVCPARSVADGSCGAFSVIREGSQRIQSDNEAEDEDRAIASRNS